MKTNDLRDFGDIYRFLFAAAVTALLFIIIVPTPISAGQEQTPSQTDSSADDSHRVDTHKDTLPSSAIEISSSNGSYTGNLNEADGQSLRLSLGKYNRYRWVFDFGRQHRFGESSVGGGVTYFRTFHRDVTLSLGGGSGTGVLSPQYSLGFSIMKSLGGVVTSVGYQRSQSKVENASDSFSLGFTRWQSHWIINTSTRLDVGHPGNTVSPGIGMGLTYYVYRKTYLSAGADFSRVSYMVVSKTQTLVNYSAQGFNVGLSQWIKRRTGINVRYNYGHATFYKTWGITFSIFQEW
jgi:YaiO family outer membrane protein